MKSRYASDGQGRQGKLPRRVSSIWSTHHHLEVENQEFAAAHRPYPSDVEKTTFYQVFCHNQIYYGQPCALSLQRILSEGEGLIYPFLEPVFHEIGSDHHTEHELFLRLAPKRRPETYHLFSISQFLGTWGCLYIKWHAVPPGFVLEPP